MRIIPTTLFSALFTLITFSVDAQQLDASTISMAKYLADGYEIRAAVVSVANAVGSYPGNLVYLQKGTSAVACAVYDHPQAISLNRCFVISK